MTSRAGTTISGEWSDHPTKSIISTAAFTTEIYSYSVIMDTTTLERRGYLSVNPKASSANCPSGRTLIATGKRLIPGVNPMTDFGTTGLGPSPGKFLLGVYDPVSGLNGFIDPSSATFTLSDTNRPPSDYLVDIAAGQSLAKAASLGSASYSSGGGGGGGGIPSYIKSAKKVLVPATNPSDQNAPIAYQTVVNDATIIPSSVIILTYADNNNYTSLTNQYSLAVGIYPNSIATGTFTILSQAGFNVYYAVF